MQRVRPSIVTRRRSEHYPTQPQAKKDHRFKVPFSPPTSDRRYHDARRRRHLRRSSHPSGRRRPALRSAAKCVHDRGPDCDPCLGPSPGHGRGHGPARDRGGRGEAAVAAYVDACAGRRPPPFSHRAPCGDPAAGPASALATRCCGRGSAPSPAFASAASGYAGAPRLSLRGRSGARRGAASCARAGLSGAVWRSRCSWTVDAPGRAQARQSGSFGARGGGGAHWCCCDAARSTGWHRKTCLVRPCAKTGEM